MFFLRHFRACGEVKLAAEQTGIALSTLYRWRKRDAAFREHWDGLAEQRRQMAEDRLMRFVREGEKTAVFHKGEQVGWRQSHTPRAALAALAYFDRREKAEEKARAKAQEKAQERNERSRFVSHSEAFEETEKEDVSEACDAPAPRKTGNDRKPIGTGEAPSPAMDRARTVDAGHVSTPPLRPETGAPFSSSKTAPASPAP